MSANNANNNAANGPGAADQPARTRESPTISSMIWKLVKDAANFVLRLYFTVFLITYHWIKKIVTRALQPLEPLREQVRKIPKKDISIEGIFYQILRLHFLVFLYFSPYLVRAFTYLTQPLVWAKNWIEEYVGDDNGVWRPLDPPVLKEG